jgi:multidrug resistance efflux pump
MNPLKGRRRYWRPALAGFALVVVLALVLIHFGPVVWSSTRAEPGSKTADETPAVVCQGHVDVEEGVAALNPEQAGRVVALPVREGQQVQAGTVLLRLDDRQAALLVRQAEGELKAARARLEQTRTLPEQHRADLAAQDAAVEAARQRLAAAEHKLRQTRRLQNSGRAAAEEAGAAAAFVKELEAAVRAEEEKRLRLRTVDPAAQVALAEAEVDARQARLEEARQALAQRVVTAPADGEVVRVLAAVGDVVGPQAGSPALWFCPDRPRVVRAEVPQEFADRVALGQAVVIQDDTQLVEVGRGQVARLSDWFTRRRSVLQEPAERNDVRTLECIVRLDPAGPRLRLGQRVRVLIGQAAGETPTRAPALAPSGSRYP